MMFYKKASESEFLAEFESHLNSLEKFEDNLIDTKKEEARACLFLAAELMEQLQEKSGIDLGLATGLVTGLTVFGTEHFDEEVVHKLRAELDVVSS